MYRLHHLPTLLHRQHPYTRLHLPIDMVPSTPPNNTYTAAYTITLHSYTVNTPSFAYTSLKYSTTPPT